jgi:hypothetical protein
MACLLTQGFTLDCKDAVGGVKNIYLINWAVSKFTVASGEVTATTVVSGDVYTYELPKATGSMIITTTVSVENGTSFNQADVAFKLRRLSTLKRNEMKLLAQGRCFCIVKNNNDEYFLVGNSYGCDVTAMVANTGTAMGDSNGYEVTLAAIEAEAPFKLQSAVATTLGI